MVRAKELFTWNPVFMIHKENDCNSDGGSAIEPLNNNDNEEEFDDEYASDVNEVPDTVFGENASSNLRSNDSVKPKENDYGCKKKLWKEERVRLLLSYSGSSSTPSYSLEPSSPNSYSSGSTTPQNHQSGTSISGGCSNCKHLLGKIKELEAAVEMHMHPEQHTHGALMSTQQYMDKVVEDVSDDDDFKSAAWVSATNYVNTFGGTVTGCLRDVDNFLKNRKLKQVVGIVKSCSPNMLSDLNVTLKDLSGTIPGTIHHNVIGKGGYRNDITVGAAMILTNVSVFSPNPSKHYLNITMRNVVEVFRKNTVLGNGSG
nr:hypothetical protein [Tanacetum cinerariifolium]